MDGVFFNSVPLLPDICLIFGSIVYIVLFQLLLVSYFIVHIYIYIFRLLFLHLPIIVFAFANCCIYISRLLFLHFPIVVFIFPDIYISRLWYLYFPIIVQYLHFPDCYIFYLNHDCLHCSNWYFAI